MKLKKSSLEKHNNMTFSFKDKQVVNDWKHQCDKVGYSYSKRLQTLMNEDLDKPHQIARTWVKD